VFFTVSRTMLALYFMDDNFGRASDAPVDASDGGWNFRSHLID
jgi:hypothetical protein